MTLATPTWITPPSDIKLSPTEVHLWRVNLIQADATIAALQPTLSVDEQQRAARFRFSVDRRRFIVGRAALRHILGRYLGQDPAMIQFCYGASGKPGLSDNRFQFNVSHSQDLMVCAIASDRLVGVDLEYVRTIADLPQLTQRFFAPQEHETIQALPEPQQLPAFFQHWTCKEALLKAAGTGLVDLRAIEVVIQAEIVTIRQGSKAVNQSNWSIQLFYPDRNFVAALAIATAPVPETVSKLTPVFWQWQDGNGV